MSEQVKGLLGRTWNLESFTLLWGIRSEQQLELLRACTIAITKPPYPDGRGACDDSQEWI